MRRNDTGRRHAASVEVKIVSEVHLRTNDFGRRHNHASCTALHAYNMYMAEIHTQKHTETHRNTQKHTETQRQTETDRDRQRQTEKNRDRQRQTETDTFVLPHFLTVHAVL